MEALLRKFAPSMVIIGAAAFCSWNYLGEGMQTMEAVTSTSKLDRGELRPELPTLDSRDLFRPVAPKASVALSSGAAAAELAATKPAEIPIPQLTATMLSGRHRMAVLNGQIYATGESFALDEDEQFTAQVMRVDTDTVVLRVGAKQMRLTFPNPKSTGVDGEPITHLARPATKPNANAKRIGPQIAVGILRLLPNTLKAVGRAAGTTSPQNNAVGL